jgi:hypothetical protein
MKNFITTYCHIFDDACSVNDQVMVRRDAASEDSWLKQLYRHLELTYPKFYKMDVLSQAGYIASVMIRNSHPTQLQAYTDDEIALVFANRFSSAESDMRFQRSYQEQKAPSPATFVYTLPNIVLGEIAIAHKWYGENMFAVLPKFDADWYVNFADILLSSDSKAVLGGWINVAGDRLEAFVFLAEASETGEAFTAANLQRLAGIDLI